MKRKKKCCGVLAAVMLVWAAPAIAHDECDDDPPKPAAVFESAKPQPVGNVTIRLFQFHFRPARNVPLFLRTP